MYPLTEGAVTPGGGGDGEPEALEHICGVLGALCLKSTGRLLCKLPFLKAVRNLQGQHIQRKRGDSLGAD